MLLFDSRDECLADSAWRGLANHDSKYLGAKSSLSATVGLVIEIEAK